MSPEHPGLRPEARSVEFQHLSLDQRNAFERLVHLLVAAASDLPGPDAWHRNPDDDPSHDDQARSSRVLFLDGERGAGKTTVAASLRDALRLPSQLGKRPTHNPDQYDRVERHVARLRERVILLETLGMESAPADTNILAALLARIEQQLFPGRGLDDSVGYAGRPENHEAVLKLLRLQTDVALAWNGNLADRGSHLDPDNYAMEELRVERVRLQLRRRFASVLRSTARDALGRAEPSLFLLVVDDVDLNPDQLIELVDRLRMVGVAELAVLLVGDLEVMETVFRLEFAAKFQGGRRRDALAGLPGMTTESLGSITNGLALAALRKHVPSRQQVKLRLLDIGDSLNLVPLGRRPEAPSLERLMATIDVALGGPADDDATLPLTEFIAPRRSGTGGQVENWYTGSTVLHDSARTIVDLWNLVDLLVDEARHRPADPVPAADEAAGPTAAAVEQPGGDAPVGLTKELSKTLRGFAAEVGLQRLLHSSRVGTDIHHAVEPSAVRRDIEDGNLTSLDLRAHHPGPRPGEYWPDTTPDTTPAVPDTPAEPSPEWDGSWAESRRSGVLPVAYTRHQGLRYRPSSLDTRYDRNPLDLDPDDIGPLILAEDLRSVTETTPHSESVVMRSARGEQTLIWVVDYSLDEDAAPEPTSESPWRPWPLPQYRLMRQVEDFGSRWNVFLDGFSSQRPKAEDLALAWVMLHTEVLAGLRASDSAQTLEDLQAKRRQDGVVRALRRLEGSEVDGEGWVGVVAPGWLRTVRDLMSRYDLADEFGGAGRRRQVQSLLTEPGRQLGTLA